MKNHAAIVSVAGVSFESDLSHQGSLAAVCYIYVKTIETTGDT
jgi:hypothetical protein